MKYVWFHLLSVGGSLDCKPRATKHSMHRAISKLDHIILSALKQFSPINSKSILKSHLATYWTPFGHPLATWR
ncbi:MAG: hypothetical protein IPG33_10130 [Betaproteobacteria bacterium]|nr:hypothetical protein [Betaproteobacteria bacterium]